MVTHILNKIKDVLEEKDLKYYCEEQNGRIGVNFPGSIMMFRVTSEFVVFKSVFKGDIPKEKRRDVLEYLNDVNCILQEGHIEMDEEGTVQFRICIDLLAEQDISEYRLWLIMGKGAHAEQTFHEGIYQIVEENMEPSKAFEEAFHKLVKRSA